jgi:hypothetical protein
MKKKLVLLLIVLISIMAIAFTPEIKLMRLELVNKTPYPATMKLTGFTPGYESAQPFYNLTVDGVDPITLVWEKKTYTLARGLYDGELWYCDLKHPTYFKLDLTKNQPFVIPPCNVKPASGIDGVIKLSPYLYPPDEDGVGLTHNLIPGYQFNWRY